MNLDKNEQDVDNQIDPHTNPEMLFGDAESHQSVGTCQPCRDKHTLVVVDPEVGHPLAEAIQVVVDQVEVVEEDPQDGEQTQATNATPPLTELGE